MEERGQKLKREIGEKEHTRAERKRGGEETEDAGWRERNGGSGKPERIRVTSLPYVRQECARDSLVNLSSKHIARV